MKKILLFLIAVSLFFACNKDDEIPNDKWTEDDNIFRCKVNGVDWEPEGDGLGFSEQNLDIYYENVFNNGIQILASKDVDNVNQSIDMFIFVETGVIGNYDILSNAPFLDFNCGKYYRDTLAQNIVDIKNIDTINNLIEGTFYFKANEGSNSTCIIDEIVVTEGYFKVKYRN